MGQNDIIASTKGHVYALLQQLDKNEKLEESDCTQILSELEELRAMPFTTKEEKLEQMDMHIETLLSEFNTSAESSRSLLHEMLQVVTEGRVPQVSEMEALNISINELRTKYDHIYSMALSLVIPEEMPTTGLSASEYVDAIQRSASVAMRKQLESIKKVLETFIAVQSLVSNYAVALLPYQNQAKALLDSIVEDNAKDVENLEIEVAGPRVFLEALSCPDIDSDEGMILLDHVSEYYPARIQNGLAAGKYFVSNPADSSTNEGVTDTSAEIKEISHAVPEDTVVDITQPTEDSHTEEKDSGLNDNIIDTDSIQTESAAEISEISEFSRAVTDSGLLLDPAKNIGILTSEISPNEGKKISTSVFQNDIRKGSEKASKAIFKEIDNQNVLTVRFLNIMKGMPEDFASGILESLLKKGYLRKYTLTPGGEFYCASPRLMKAMTFKDAAKTVGIRQKPIEDWGISIADKVTSAASRIVHNKLYCDSVQRLVDKGISSFTETGGNATDCFVSRVGEAGKSIWDLNVGVFWDNCEDCDVFVEQFEDAIKDPATLNCIVFASASVGKANVLATLLTDKYMTISNKPIFLYSFEEDSYYSFPEQTKVDFLQVGVASTEISATSEEKPDMVIESTIEESSNGLNEVPNPAAVSDEVSDNTSSERTVVTAETVISEKTAPKKAGKSESETDLMEHVISLLNARQFYAATAYAKAYALQHSATSLFYNQLAHAINDPMARCSYATDNVFTLIEKQGEFEDALVLSTALRTFYSNQIRYDYNLKSFYSGVNHYKLLSESPALGKTLYTLMDFKVAHQKGLDAYADYRSRSKAEVEQDMHNLQAEARIFYENYVVGQKKERAKQKRFLETKKLIFSATSDFGGFLKAIVEGDTELQPLALDFLQTNFYKEDSVIDIDTIDSDKLWDYITVFWERAGDLMMYRKNNTDLMSHLRNNIVALVTKAVQLMARWCDLVDRGKNHSEDEGEANYKKIRKPLLDNIAMAIAELESMCSDPDTLLTKKAGLNILIQTLKEISACIDGSFREEERKYFYAPFLLSDEVMLEEEYYPDLAVHSSELTALDPKIRILNHVKKVLTSPVSFEDRLTSILDEQGDDYGQARLIIGYLQERSPSDELTSISATIDAGEAYAKETADLRKDDFVGDLELAQSYGQIDNSEEDKKEKILQIIDEWYEWAIETANYGFFKKVMDCYLAEIKEEARSREIDLLQQLESFKAATLTGISAEDKENRILRIQGMIRSQNYTVAEDLLARATATEEENEELIEENFLEEFLDNYDDYYQPVATHKSSFASLVSSRTRNKEERGAKRLADNWLPGGSLLGKDRLQNLLTCFGFKVDSIKTLNAIGKFEHFHVQTAKAQGGQRDNYTHPIAAFGSGAALEGFRVVCINGGYDADGLIDVMKQIGNAQHTLVLLDYALSKSERRRLARKSKNALGDKLFGVVDRTVMMFLVRNYDETRMNRMLVSLITPFGYYQPYVWESANVMPPEIFMGRKLELERIKSPTGVNIVYGGRQLGKSALLKKAKEDIDWDENENRAVLVDIKGLDYKKAANKIGHELYDSFVLEQDIDTEDWNELARAVRRRLQSDTKRIPYLLLLLDEADVFIDSCAAINYQPFDALKDIQSIGAGRFKFVIAGLRNIVRFKREALGNNSVLTHLQPMTVKPFNTSEARELMEIPLHYLGLRFPKEKESLVTLILATTNYFPGLIQMYCAKLINAMRSKDYANYDEVDTPIYEVSEEHIKKVLADPEFMQQIREKFIITLKLDEDNYYYLIALLMAYLYHSNGYSEGYSANDIKCAGTELEISKIASLDINKLESFMEELKELNVLRSTDESRYLFTRFTFFQMMGTRLEVDDKLMEYIGE